MSVRQARHGKRPEMWTGTSLYLNVPHWVRSPKLVAFSGINQSTICATIE